MKKTRLQILFGGIVILLLGCSIRAGETEKYLNYQVRALPFQIIANGTTMTAKFTNPDRGWVFGEFSVPLSAMEFRRGDSVIANTAQLVKKQEFMLKLEPGDYTVTATTDAPNCPVSIKRIHRVPEIYFYAPGSTTMPEIEFPGTNAWTVLGDQLLASTSIIAPGFLKPEDCICYRQAGRKIFFNTSHQPIANRQADLFAAAVRDPLTIPGYDGFTVDEFDCGDTKSYADYGKGLALLDNPSHKGIYTWGYFYGEEFPDGPQVRDLMTTAVHVPGGNGKLLLEIYLGSLSTPEQSEQYFQARIINLAKRIHAMDPNYMPHLGVILGVFNEMPVLTLERFPEIDFKYCLDRQLNLIVNCPELKNLGVVGYWGGSYCQEELQRWSLALLRHYFIDGKKTMLSERYGYHYEPGILKNGDFSKGFQYWTPLAAEKDSVVIGQLNPEKFALPSQGRWRIWDWKNDAGKTFALVRRSSHGANILSQKLIHLIPGQPYQLQFAVADYADMEVPRSNPRRLGFEAEFNPQEVGIRSSSCFVDHREKSSHVSGPFAHTNIHRIVFVPRTAETILTLTDRSKYAGKPGEILAVNFVQVKPYFAPEMQP